MLKQGKGAPVDVEKQVAILYAVVNNILSGVDAAKIGEYEEGLYRYLDQDPDGIDASAKSVRKRQARGGCGTS